MQGNPYPPILEEDYIPIGYARKPHALTGEIFATLEADLSPLLDEAEEPLFLMLRLDGLLVPFHLTSYRERNDGSLIRFARVATQADAMALQGAEILIHRELLETEDEDGLKSYIGYTVYDQNGLLVGRISDVDETTLNVLFEITKPNGELISIPAADELIMKSDVHKMHLIMDIPEGLLDL